MKVEFFSESPADQAALAVFAEGLLGAPPESGMDLQAHGVTGVLNTLNNVIRAVYYQSDAEGLVVVVDCDETEFHDPSHNTPGGGGERCRYCKMRQIITQTQQQLKARQGRPRLNVAIGLALPAIEAWYLVGKERQVGEAPWKVGLESGRQSLTKPKLKERVYGTDRPSLELETECAVKEARRLIADIQAIEDGFPTGFGLMAKEIRSWTSQAR